MTVTHRFAEIDREMTERLISDGSRVAERVVRELRLRGLKVATAESCTGGLIGGAITGVSGASEIYLGGVISYTNEIKTGILGVSEEVIREHTEVSFEAAEEMARCVMERFGSDIGISATGFAGPTGGNEHDPVRTVYIGLSSRDTTKVWRLHFSCDATRDEVRAASVSFAVSELIGLCEK